MSDKKRKVPKLRFPGFTDAWEQRKLGEVGCTFTGLSGKSKDDFGHGNAKYVTYLNVLQNPVGSITQLDNIEIDEKQNAVKQGDVFFTTSSETPDEVGMSSVWKYDIPNIYLNSFTFGYRPNQEFDLDYLAYMLRSDSVRQKIKLLAQGISRFNISKTKMMEISIPIASDKEQTEIGKLFANVEALLSLHQRKLDNVKMLKKSLLQKLFPKDGEKIPELRFPGFTDDWEQRKLGDMGKVSMCKRVFKSETSEIGEVPFYKIGTFGEVADSYISKDLFEEYRDKYSYPKVGDILISASGSIGRTVVYTGQAEYFQDSNIVWLDHGGKIDNRFLLAFYSVVKWSGIEGSTIKRLYNENILNTQISLPSLSEQATVGNFFREFDSLISLHQRKLDHLKELKKGLLQQMFV